MKRKFLLYSTVLMLAVFANGCGTDSQKPEGSVNVAETQESPAADEDAAKTGLGTQDEEGGDKSGVSGSAVSAPGEETKKEPALRDIAEANLISYMVKESGTVKVALKTFEENGDVKDTVTVVYGSDEQGQLISDTVCQLGGEKKTQESYYRMDGKQYRKHSDGSLMLMAAGSDSAKKAYYDAIDAVESPFLFVEEEELVSCKAKGELWEIETSIDYSKLSDARKEALGVSEGVGHMVFTVSMDTLCLVHLEGYLEKDGKRVRTNETIVETGVALPEMPNYVEEFEKAEKKRTITMIYDLGTEKEHQIVYKIPKKASFSPVYEDAYDIYGDKKKKTELKDVKLNQGKDITLYLFFKDVAAEGSSGDGTLTGEKKPASDESKKKS